jgi:chromosome segregation ATPase
MSSKTAPTTTDTLAVAQADLAAAEAALGALQAEQAQLPAALAAAAEAADAGALVRLRQRGDALGTELYAAKAQQLRLRIAVFEAELPRRTAAAVQLQGELEAAVAWQRQAEQAVAQAGDVYREANADRHDVHWELGAAKRELAAHLATGVRELGHAAPIVRSLPHQPRAS